MIFAKSKPVRLYAIPFSTGGGGGKGSTLCLMLYLPPHYPPPQLIKNTNFVIFENLQPTGTGLNDLHTFLKRHSGNMISSLFILFIPSDWPFAKKIICDEKQSCVAERYPFLGRGAIQIMLNPLDSTIALFTLPTRRLFPNIALQIGQTIYCVSPESAYSFQSQLSLPSQTEMTEWSTATISIHVDEINTLASLGVVLISLE